MPRRDMGLVEVLQRSGSEAVRFGMKIPCPCQGLAKHGSQNLNQSQAKRTTPRVDVRPLETSKRAVLARAQGSPSKML